VAICLRRAQAFWRSEGSSAEDDFDVLVNDKRIGRIYFDAKSSLPWRWILSSVIAADVRGRAATRQLAAEAIRDAYRQFDFKKSDIPPVHALRNLQSDRRELF
jgi:hypothetical protein